MDLGLVPSTLLTFSWHPDMVDEIQSGLKTLIFTNSSLLQITSNPLVPTNTLVGIQVIIHQRVIHKLPNANGGGVKPLHKA